MPLIEQIGRYKIVGELGRGAMGIVYKAQDPAIGRMIAIKSIRWGELTDESERERLRERLFREAQSAGILSHPNIVTIYDIADEGEMAYIFMELVNGPSLERMLKTDEAPDKETLLSLLRQTAIALDYAHKKGIVHRDIKPANIMVHDDGTAKITDFGIAKIISQNMTRAGTIMGTPSYMSPEQIQGTAITGRADQFSLAVIAYEILTGEKPFNAEYLPTLLFKIVREAAPPPHRLNPTLPAALDPVIRRALSKNPEERFETCSDFIDALAEACGDAAWMPLPRGASASLPTAGSSDKITARSLELFGETVAARPEEMIPAADSTRVPTQPMREALPSEAAQLGASEAAVAEPLVAASVIGEEKTEPNEPAEIEVNAGVASETTASGEKALPKPVDWAALPKPPAIPQAATVPPAALPPVAAGPVRIPRSRQDPPPSGHGLRNAFLGLIVALALASGVLYFMRGSLPISSSWQFGTSSQEAPPPIDTPASSTAPVAAAPAKTAPATPTPADSATASDAAAKSNAPVASSDAAPTPATSTTPATSSGAPAASASRDTTPSETPAAMAFQLTTTPAGAQATIDRSSNLRCTSPCSLTLPLGRHTILIHRDGFRDVQRVFNLPDDPGLIVSLSPLTGVVSLSSMPSGLAIFVDGKEQTRRTPTSLLLPVGPHTIQIVKDGQKQEFTVDVRDGVVTERSIDWAN